MTAAIRLLGFIGLGRMGLPMAARLIRAGYPVTGFDVAPAARSAFGDVGGILARSPADVAARSELTLSVLMDDAILHDVALGQDGVLAGARRGHFYCDLSTVTPAASERVAAACAASGIRYVRAKMAGSVQRARDATLTIFTSGAADDLEAVRPVLALLGERVVDVGTDETAHYLKLVHSAIVGVYAALLGEALTFGARGGVDFDQMVDILEAGPLGSVQLSLKAPALKARDFDHPPSDIDTAAKDLDMILETARHAAVPMPLTAAVRQIMAVAQAHGQGKRDIYAILETFESLAAMAVPS